MPSFDPHRCLCDWCGKPATHLSYRTLYENTEAEQISKYHECDSCFFLKSEELLAKVHLPKKEETHGELSTT